MPNPFGLPAWSKAPNRMAAVYADGGFTNLVTGSPYGAIVQQGGSVDLNAAAGPNGLPGFRFNASTGGILVSTTAVNQAQPFTTITVVRARNTPAANACFVGSQTGGSCSQVVTSLNKYRMAAGAPTGGLDSAVVDPTQWHIVVAVWHSYLSQLILENGAAANAVYNTPWPGGAFAGLGFSIGGQGDGSGTRDNFDVYGFEIWDGYPIYEQLVGRLVDLSRQTGIALTVVKPTLYSPANPYYPPQLSARPAQWSIGATTAAQTKGQSNGTGRNDTSSIQSWAAGNLIFTKHWSVAAASDPMSQNSLGVFDGITADSTQTSGYQAAAANAVQAGLGINISYSNPAVSGTASSLWLPPAFPTRAHLCPAAVAQYQEMLYWGQKPGWIDVCQGEADADGPTWKSNWLAEIAYTRAVLGIPKLPYFFVQTPSAGGVRAFEPNISDPSNNIFFIPTTLGANLQGGGVHWTATGYDLAGQALGAQILSGWPYF